jgi:hypothetical protein
MLLGIGPQTYDSEHERKEVERIRSGRFGLGTKRTLEQVTDFTGINLFERKMVENKCGNLIWVPFTEGEIYGVSDALTRGLAGGTVDTPVAVSRPVLKNDIVLTLATKPQPEIKTTRVWIVAGVFFTLVAIVRVIRRRIRKKGDRHKN